MSSNNVVSYQPTNLEQLTSYAERLSKSLIVPAQFRGKPNDILVACLWGWETAELPPLTSLAYIDVIEGRAAYKSEALAGIALRKGHILDIDEQLVGEPGSDDYAAVCTVVKKNGKPLTRKFSIREAKKAGLYTRQNWQRWTDRMLIARARGFAVRDAAPAALLSYTSEEVRDFDEPVAASAIAAPVAMVIDAQAEPLAPAKDAAVAFASTIAERPVEPVEAKMLEDVRIFDHDGKECFRGNAWKTALTKYGEAKKKLGADPTAVAVANIAALRTIAGYVAEGTKWREALDKEIAAIEAVIDSYEHEGRAIDDADNVDEDGVVCDRAEAAA